MSLESRFVQIRAALRHAAARSVALCHVLIVVERKSTVFLRLIPHPFSFFFFFALAVVATTCGQMLPQGLISHMSWFIQEVEE